MGQRQADEDKGAGKSANDHFHNNICLSSVKTACHKRSDQHSIEAANDRIARQRASAGRTAHKLVIGKTKASANDRSDNYAQNHGLGFLHRGAVTAASGLVVAAPSSQDFNAFGATKPTSASIGSPPRNKANVGTPVI